MGWTSRVTGPIRLAADKLKGWDEAYAARAYRDMEGYPEPARGISRFLGATPVSEGGSRPEATWQEAAAEELFTAGVRGTNLGYRYGLPAAGLTAAGQAMMELTNQFNTQLAEAPEPGQLSMN